MGKISPVSSKYLVHTLITIDGTVDKPDVIGAVFGQTEGLLGSELELRELQRSGRIGRIEVNTETKGGKTSGAIIIPSSLDKAETAIVAAALEIIERIGPCNAKIKVQKIEDIRLSKRSFIVNRAKELLQNLMDEVIPDSQELTEEVTHSVRTEEMIVFGPDKLPAGPDVVSNEEIIIVEGRADVITLLKQGFKNAIAMNGTSVPKTIVELTKKKTVTVFTDGDRGGDLIIQELLAVGDIDYIVKAPDGKEVEELTKKEMHKALRSRVVPAQFKPDTSRSNSYTNTSRYNDRNGRVGSRERSSYRSNDTRSTEHSRYGEQKNTRFERAPRRPISQTSQKMSERDKQKLKSFVEQMIGTRGAVLLDQNFSPLGKVPVSGLASSLEGLGNVHAIVIDGTADATLVTAASKAKVQCVVASDSAVSTRDVDMQVLKASEL